MNLLTKLLITLCELAHEAAHNGSQTCMHTHKTVHSTQKIVHIHLCLYIIQVHEQFANHRELLTNIRELGGNFFAKYHTLSSRGKKVKNISKISSRSCDRWNPAIAMLPQITQNQRKLIDEHCESVC